MSSMHATMMRSTFSAKAGGESRLERYTHGQEDLCSVLAGTATRVLSSPQIQHKTLTSPHVRDRADSCRNEVHQSALAGIQFRRGS